MDANESGPAATTSLLSGTQSSDGKVDEYKLTNGELVASSVDESQEPLKSTTTTFQMRLGNALVHAPYRLGDPNEIFEFSSELGEGAFGRVWRARWKQPPGVAGGASEVAVKMLSTAAAGFPWHKLVREVKMWDLMRHPNLLKLHDVIENPRAGESNVSLVCEIMLGGELFDLLDSVERFSERMCQQAIAQVAAGLAHLHLELSICHRDLKPSNILCRTPSCPPNPPLPLAKSHPRSPHPQTAPKRH